MKTQTTKEQVIEKLVVAYTRKIHPQDLGKETSKLEENLREAISSTYDTAYEKGVRDAMELIGEDMKYDPETTEFVYIDPSAVDGANRERSRLRLALSELLKK